MAEPSLIPFSPADQEALADLCRLLRFSEGEFALIVAVCNTSRHRQRVVEQLQQQCPKAYSELTLDPTTTTLFTPLRDRVPHPTGDPTDTPPPALLVYDLEGVRELDQVLTATNQIREEFRQLLCPVVLWLSDDSLKRLMRTAPDFYTWASTVTFTPPPTDYADFLAEVVADVWEQIGRSRENRFLSNTELGLTPGSPRCQELDRALRELAAQQVSLPPAQVAALDLVQGRIADNNTPQARELYEHSLAGWQALAEQEHAASPAATGTQPTQDRGGDVAAPSQLTDSATPYPPDLVSPLIGLGYAQFYLGLWWINHAARRPSEFAVASPIARGYCAACVTTFERSERPDLMAKYINYWALTLHRLEVWDELEAVATRAVALHERQPSSFRLARAQGFLAEVALERQDWAKSHRLATAALALIQPMAVATATVEGAEFYAWINSFHRGWYLFSLGKAEQGNGDLETAIATLRQALDTTQPHDDPRLYSAVLERLRQCCYQQGDYLAAFQAFRDQLAIDNRFNLAPFVGAGRLQPKREVTNPALPASVANLMVPDALDLIATSGRGGDVDRLLARLARDEFKLTIIYGPSGVGKSSLLEAGLVPVLQHQRFEGRRGLPIYLRYYTNWAADLLTALGADLPTDGAGASPNLVLTALRQHTQHNRMVVLIFDQFEEFFFEYAQPALRQEFYGLLQRCLAMPFIKVVLSLREDYIYYLLDCNRRMALDIIGDDILAQRWLYYLGNFKPTDAAGVVRDLLKPTPYGLEPLLVEQMVTDLAAELEAVRPIELQIVGAQLLTEDITTLAAYEQLGSDAADRRQGLVQGYLDGLVAHCGPPEPHQRLANVVLFCLTNEQGTRPLRTAAELQQELLSLTNTQQLDGAVFALVLNILNESGLVQRVEAQPEPKYQLVHDYLAAFIRSSRQPVMAALARERGLREEEERKRFRQARWAVTGLGLLMMATLGAGMFAWRQQTRTDLNTQFQVQSLAMEAHIENGLERDAVAKAMQTGQTLLDTSANQLDADTRLRVLSSMREVMYEAKERERLIGHGGPIYSVALAPSGDIIATASADGTVRLWRADSGEPLPIQLGHDDRVYRVGFSPNGDIIATASTDRTVRLWRADSGEPLPIQLGHDDRVHSLAFSPSGNTIATASADGTVRLWQANSGELLPTQLGHSTPVHSVVFDPSGDTIATASANGMVSLWQADSGEPVQTLIPPQPDADDSGERLIHRVAFSPDGTLIVAAGSNGVVRLWNREGQPLWTFRGHQLAINDVAFSPNSRTLVTVSHDGTAKLWNRNGSALQTLTGHSGPIHSVVFRDDSSLITGSSDGTAKLWNRGGLALTSLEGHAKDVYGLAFFPPPAGAPPSSGRIATASVDTTVRLWSGAGEALSTLDDHSRPVTSVAFSPDGETLATAGRDGRVKLWDAEGTLLRTLSGHNNTIWSVTFSPDGETIATASSDRTIKLWSLAGEELNILNGHTDEVRSVAFAPNGEIATASEDGTAKLWNQDGELLQTLTGHSLQVYRVAFSPDGEIIATASEDGTVRLWDRKGVKLQTLTGHTLAVVSVTFSHSGEIVATASWDGTVKLWNLKGQELQTLVGPSGHPIWDVAFGAGDQAIITAHQNGAVYLWDLTLENLMATGCDWLGTYFVQQIPERLMELEFCQTYVPDITVAAVPQLVRQGQQLVRSGNEQQAAELFQQALVWDRTLDLDPQTLIQNTAAAQTQVDKGERLVRDGDVDAALVAYRQAEVLDAEGISANHWNTLCYHGSRHDQAEKVIFACNNAVALDPVNNTYIDHRGLARALTGNTPGAIADFTTFIAEFPDITEKARSQRQAWIDTLEQGENPFTPDVLAELR